MSTTTLTRPQQGKVIAGVCAGLAQRFGWNANVVRLLFLLSCLLPGPQFVIYLVLWVVMPYRAESLATEPRDARRDLLPGPE